MRNIDKDIAGNVHMFIALRRRKDNAEGKEICFRQICIDHYTDLECIRARIKKHIGNWRIHKTINLRSTESAMRLLMKNLIDDPSRHDRLMSEYKTALMRRESKSQRNILIDIDGEESNKTCISICREFDSLDFAYCTFKSPNGWHIVAENFDTRLMEKYPEVTLQRDGYYFVEKHKITTLPLDNEESNG
jgi:hypothetical protein